MLVRDQQQQSYQSVHHIFKFDRREFGPPNSIVNLQFPTGCKWSECVSVADSESERDDFTIFPLERDNRWCFSVSSCSLSGAAQQREPHIGIFCYSRVLNFCECILCCVHSERVPDSRLRHHIFFSLRHDWETARQFQLSAAGVSDHEQQLSSQLAPSAGEVVNGRALGADGTEQRDKLQWYTFACDRNGRSEHVIPFFVKLVESDPLCD